MEIRNYEDASRALAQWVNEIEQRKRKEKLDKLLDFGFTMDEAKAFMQKKGFTPRELPPRKSDDDSPDKLPIWGYRLMITA